MILRPVLREPLRDSARQVLLRRGGGRLPPMASSLFAWKSMGIGQTRIQGALDQPSFISGWMDRLNNGRDYAQATAVSRPGAPWDGYSVFDGTLLCDGTSDFIKTGAAALAQPYTRAWRLKQKSWTDNDYVADGFTDNRGALVQKGVSPGLSLYAGLGFACNNTAATVDTWVSVVAVFDGANSVLRINGVEVTGNPGTNALDGFTLGAAPNGGGQWSNVQYAEELAYPLAADATQRADIEAYLNTVNPRVLPTSTAYKFFGDSITVGIGATVAGWPTLLAASPSISIAANYAVSGDQAIDQAPFVFGNAAGPSCFMLGTNDQRTGGYGSNATKRAIYGKALQSMVAWEALPTKTSGQGSTNTSGTWANAAVYGGAVAVQSSTSGSQRTVLVNGDKAFIWTLVQDGQTGTWKVTEAGVTKATGTTAPAATMASINGATFGPTLTIISGLGAGPHTLVFETTNAGLSYFLGAAGIGDNAPASLNPVYVSNVISPNATGLATFGVDETNIGAYNTEISTQMGALTTAGVSSVAIVDNHSLTILYTDDGLHPRQAGYQQLADQWKLGMGAL